MQYDSQESNNNPPMWVLRKKSGGQGLVMAKEKTCQELICLYKHQCTNVKALSAD
jgi:hypothetical protein